MKCILTSNIVGEGKDLMLLLYRSARKLWLYMLVHWTHTFITGHIYITWLWFIVYCTDSSNTAATCFDQNTWLDLVSIMLYFNKESDSLTNNWEWLILIVNLSILSCVLVFSYKWNIWTITLVIIHELSKQNYTWVMQKFNFLVV